MQASSIQNVRSVALACKGPLNARLATGVGLSFFLSKRAYHLFSSSALPLGLQRTLRFIPPLCLCPLLSPPLLCLPLELFLLQPLPLRSLPCTLLCLMTALLLWE
jgi:hypothetical protein